MEQDYPTGLIIVAAPEPIHQSLPKLPQRVVSTTSQLDDCCRHLADKRKFGLDTEFVGEDTYHTLLCLVQVATEDCLFLIDPQTVGPLDAFWKLVVDPENLVVVHAAREEVRLCQLWSGFTPGNLFDLQIAAGLTGYNYPLSHSNLVHQVLRIRLGKEETLTEWRNRPLTESQIRYAFEDVQYLLPMWERLTDKLDKLGRLDWAKEEFTRLKELTAPSEDSQITNSKWRKLRGTGGLDRRRLAILQSLFEWREEVAAKTNRPPRSIIRDDLLVEVARRNPTKPRDLQVLRGLPKRSLDELLDVVREAKKIPIQDCPEVKEREQDPPQLAIINHIMTAALSDTTTRKQLSTQLVASNADLKSWVRACFYGRPWPTELPLCQGWRAKWILPELEAILNGERSLTISNMKSAAPLTYGDMANQGD